MGNNNLERNPKSKPKNSHAWVPLKGRDTDTRFSSFRFSPVSMRLPKSLSSYFSDIFVKIQNNDHKVIRFRGEAVSLKIYKLKFCDRVR